VVNKTSENVTAIPNVELSVVKKANVTGTVLVGDKIKYEIVVTNSGLSDASDVKVIDVIDTKLVEIVDTETTQGYDSTINGWIVSSIESGKNTTLYLVVKVIANGTISNSVNVTSKENDTNVTNSSVDVDADPLVKFTINKTVNVTAADVVLVGDKLNYIITVKNIGLSDATAINVTDAVDTTLVEVITAESSPNYNTVVSNGWRIDSLAPNAETTLNLVVWVKDAGKISNTVAVNSDENKTTVTNKSDDVTSGTVILNATKSANVSEVKVGDEVKFIINVTNIGTMNATDVVINDTLDSVFEFINATEGGVFSNGVVTWNIGDLAVNTPVSVEVIVKVKNHGKFNNTAVVTSKENKTETNGTTNITVIPYVDLDVVKEANVTIVKVGEYIKFTITVTNTGLSNATNVKVSDKLNDAFEFNNTDYGIYNQQTHTVEWTINNITAGKSAEVYVIVKAQHEGTFNNTAVVYSDENKTKSNGTEVIVVGEFAVLEINKSANVSEVKVGDEIMFTITVNNIGTSDATDVVITDVLDAAFGHLSGGTYNNQTRTVTWTIDKLASRSSTQVNVTVKALSNGTFVNNVTANCHENKTDVNASSDNITVNPFVDITVSKEANVTEAVVGDRIQYTIIVVNNGLSNATDVKVWDILPAGVEYVSGADYYDNATRNASWTFDNIAPDKITFVTLRVNVTGAGNLSNIVFANSKENKTPVNATSDNVTVDPNVELNITKVANVTSAVVGDNIMFTINVTNNGLSNATNVVVSDVLDAAFDHVSGGVYNETTRTVTWTIPGIDAGKSAEVYVVVKVLTNGTFANAVTAYAQENKTPSNATSDDIPVIPNVELNITKVADVTSAVVGDNITFTIKVTNNGLSNATNVVVYDVLDEAFEHMDGGDYDVITRNVTWTISSIEAGESAEVYVVVKVLTNGTFANVVSTYSQENKTPVNATSDNVTVIPNVELDITKVANVTEIIVGDSIEYTITVKNNGLSDAVWVYVWDILPEGMEYVSGADGYDISTRNVTWGISSIAAGESKSVYLVVNVTDEGNVSNTVFANSEDNKTVVNKTSDNVTVTYDVELTIDKYANVTEAVVGDSIEYTIVIVNNGKSDATDVKVWDILPAGVEYVSGADNYDKATRNASWTIDKIASDQITFVTIRVNVTGAGNLANTVFTNSKENKTPVNKTSDNVTVNPNVELDMTKVADVTSVIVGDNITFTIKVTNNGLSDATNVVVSDVLAEAFGYVSGGSYDEATRTVTWTIESIASKTSKEVYVTVSALTAGNFTNTVLAHCDENITDVNGTSDNVTVDPNVKLDVTKVADVTSVIVGDNITFTIRVTNNGLSDATNVVVSDKLDAAFEYINGGDYDAATRTVTWIIGNIGAGKTEDVYVVVGVLTNGTFTNTVSAYADENKTPVNGTSDNLTVNPDVQLDIAKVSNVTAVYVGENIRFTITITNNGLSNATNVKIGDVLPDGVKFVFANGTYVNDGQNVLWTIENIAGKSQVSVYVDVTAVTAGPIVNFANVTCDENSTSKTNTSKIDINPVVDLTVVKTANVSNIYVGGKVCYNIVVSNNGPSDANNVIIVDELPTGLKFVSSNVECVVAGNEVTWTVSKLAADENITIEVVCIALGSGDLTNTVIVTCDENKTNTTGGVPIHVKDLVDVAIELSVDNSTPDINGEIVLTLKVRNNGPSNATSIVGKLNKDFLNGLEIISIDSEDIIFPSGDLLGYCLSDILRVNEDGSFTIDSLNAGEEVSATIKARVIRDGVITVDGNVSSAEDDSNLENNYDNVTLTVHSLVDLKVNVTSNDTTPFVGDEIEYTITVVNNGPSNGTGIVVNDKLPDGVTYVSDNGGGRYDPNTGVWTIDSLKTNESKTLTIKVKVNRAGEITNVVNVTADQDNTDPDGGKTKITINAADKDVDLSISKSVSATKAYVGDLITYTITVVNRGTSDATGVLVLENLTDGLRYVSDDSQGKYDFNYGIWYVGNLNAGESAVLNIVVQVTKVGNITNYVIVICDQEIIDINSTVANVTVEVVEHAENETDVPVPAEAALKETGNPIMMLLMVLLSAGICLIRRKD
ncbi:MAG: DUF11 domain-containing protein, partial [Methanobrevibacter sp.]|nr:DUF11 domain-containing protein [Methanobrevibacter sp.]